ncbi:HNH endonuclease [Achromobacter spanius]|uniref:HNH endonuclease n=1 Tax=Achromobacter spanius TaxID=217203 RepID=UPI0037FFF3A9
MLCRVLQRNPDVSAEVLHRAAGRCEGCASDAPLGRPDGRPYLEVRHRLSWADGGEDTVENATASCPNCHQERHYNGLIDVVCTFTPGAKA